MRECGDLSSKLCRRIVRSGRDTILVSWVLGGYVFRYSLPARGSSAFSLASS